MKEFVANLAISTKIILITLTTIVLIVCGYGIAHYVNSLMLSIVIVLVAIVLSFFVANRVARTILAPVNEISETMESVSKGDLTKRIQVVRKD